ncbi:Retinaldehyde-binding protein 1 [Orchesella cincta]|uniref:Retinaldehyde-binding protein 1 n=1 Tax=Orchesella cincta TaxID=48709 RepID=A0A1D2M975_ORCCI|nr:Retinaldehyde-binding protein 1 [Orchesella cincta]
MEAVFREELERDGLHEMHNFITEFLKSGKGTPAVREYISAVADDDSKLGIYLKGRKYRPKHAWETLLRYAEVRFNEYPELFPETVPDSFLSIFKTGVVSLLKTRDHLGRRILCFNFGKWEPSEISLEQITATYTYPIRLKAFYYLNLPSYALYVHKFVKPFLSKKLKERLIISTTDRKFEVLHENISPKLLPKFLGGTCENETALDLDIIYNKTSEL